MPVKVKFMTPCLRSLAAAQRWIRYGALLVISFCLAAGLAAAAQAQTPLTWENLQPQTTLQNPYAHLTSEQTYDVAALSRLEAWVEETQAALDSREAQERSRLEAKLQAQGLDVAALLAQVDQAKAYWEHQSSTINTEWTGQSIQLTGYLLPLTQTVTQQVKDFLLVPYVGACIHVPPPPPNQIIYIKPPQALAVSGMFARVVVEGELRSQPATYELFQVDGSRPVEVNYALSLENISYAEPGTADAPLVPGPWWQRVQTRASMLLTQAVGDVEQRRSPQTFFWGLLIAFSYGVLHTLGPGHGKAIIISYFVGQGGSLQRGLAMGVRIAVFHVLSAIAVVLLINLVLRQSMPENYRVVRLVSYGSIALIGGWMLWQARPWRHRAFGAENVDSHADTKAADGLEGKVRPRAQGAAMLYPNLTQQVTHPPASDAACACLTCIEPKRASDWLSLAVGSVPCSGALLILLYGSANGLLWPSIAMVVAISVGMAITLAYIGVLALMGRDYAARQVDRRLGAGRYRHFQRWLSFAGAGSVLLLGVGLFGVTLAAGV